MKQLISFTFFNILFLYTFGQDDSVQKINFKLQKDKFYTAELNKKWDGYIINMNDTTIITTFHKNSYGILSSGKATPYTDIDLLTIKRDGIRFKRAAWGSLIGFSVGGIIGAASYNPSKTLFGPSSAGESAVFGGILGLLPGAIFGALIEPAKHRFKINRRKDNYEKIKYYLTRD